MIKCGIIGISGYAEKHLDIIDGLEGRGEIQLTAAVVRSKTRAADQLLKWRIAERGIKLYSCLDDLIQAEKGNIELIILPVGPEFHRSYSIQCMEAGFHVLCEKPPAITIQDVDAMIETSKRTGKICNIGFQSQYFSGLLDIKKRICEGEIGKIKSVSVRGEWRRSEAYYTRNDWAGKLYHKDEVILDGTVANPFAHDLMNTLFFASETEFQTAEPKTVQAELYRGHKIESEDTSFLRATLEDGTTVSFCATLCGHKSEIPTQYEIIGEKGRILISREAVATYKVITDTNTIEIEYSEHSREEREKIILNTIKAIKGEEKALCPVKMTRNYVLFLNAAFESALKTIAIPETELIMEEDEQWGVKGMFTAVVDIKNILDRSYLERKLPSELNIKWAVASNPFKIAEYKEFKTKITSE